MKLDQIPEELAAIFSGRRWIILNGVSANTQTLIDQLRKWGGEEFLVVAGQAGVGPQPEVETVFMPSLPGTVMEGFRRFIARVEDPPPEVRKAVSRFDPDGSGRALGPLFAVPDLFLGHRLYGARPLAWEKLEDKTVADSIWDEAGVPRAPAEVVALEEAISASDRLSSALGSVWAADNSEGWHGGGELTRWVPDAGVGREVVEEFEGRIRRVRVMPFLDGLPCSIHGVITSDGVAALRPVELLILRQQDRRGFLYAGVANMWDPPSEVREEMRETVRAVADVLVRRHGHRGPFAIDGVATADGFRPTELNPRFSIGYGIQAATVPELHGGFFVRAVVEGDLDPEASVIEKSILAGADSARAIRMGAPVTGVHQPASMRLTVRNGRVVPDPEGDVIEVGSSPSGSFLLWDVRPDLIPRGASFAPYVAEALRIVDSEWNLGLPPIEAAPVIDSSA
jgi:hypothetical protein